MVATWSMLTPRRRGFIRPVLTSRLFIRCAWATLWPARPSSRPRATRARPTWPAWPRSRKERPRVSSRRRNLAGTRARGNAVDAIVLHGFVRRKVDADRDRRGLPDEPLPEDDL